MQWCMMESNNSLNDKKSLHFCETLPQSIPFSDARCKEDYEESHVITSKKGPKVCTLLPLLVLITLCLKERKIYPPILVHQ